MPSDSVSFRPICGHFVYTFISFMNRRARDLYRHNAMTVPFTFRWPLSVARTFVVCCFLLCLCHFSGTCSTGNVIKTEGSQMACSFFDSVTFNSYTYQIYADFYMIATEIVFILELRKDRALQTSHVYFYPKVMLLVPQVTVYIAVVFCARWLLECGDVEANPGPIGHEDLNSTTSLDDSSLTRYYRDMNQSLDRAVLRIEQANEQQGQRIEGKLESMEIKIDHRLAQIEEEQAKLSKTVHYLQAECQTVWEENQELKGLVGSLSRKCDYLENQSKRNNLIFSGVPVVTKGIESWDDCEGKVERIIKDGLGIEDNITIERAHRVGKNIIARFLSFKDKALILRNARKLKNSELFSGVFINEDFSELVQKKRQNLFALKKKLRDNGKQGKLRFDKLITDTDIYTYDIENQQLVREGRRYVTDQNLWRNNMTQSSTLETIRESSPKSQDANQLSSRQISQTTDPQRKESSSQQNPSYNLRKRTGSNAATLGNQMKVNERRAVDQRESSHRQVGTDHGADHGSNKGQQKRQTSQTRIDSMLQQSRFHSPPPFTDLPVPSPMASFQNTQVIVQNAPSDVVSLEERDRNGEDNHHEWE